MRKKNDEAKLEIYEVEAMADTVRKDYVSGFIAGIFIGSAAGFILNQVKKRKQQENVRKEVQEDQNKTTIKDKVNEQKEAIKTTTQDQLDGMKNMVEQIKDAIAEQMKSDEQQETEQKKLRAEKAAIRNEVAAHDLKDVSPQAQEVQKNDNPLASSQDVTTPSHEFTATGNAQAAKAKAKLMASDKNVADKVAELFKAQPVKSSGYTTVPVLVTVAAVAKKATENKPEAKAKAKENKPASNDKASKQVKPTPKAAEKRTAQTHESAKFDNGVIAHDKATANHSSEPKTDAKKQVVVTKNEETPTAKVESKTVNNTQTTKSQTTKTTNTPKKTTSTTTKTAKATSSKDATKTTTKTTRKPASKGSKTTTQKTTTKTTKTANGSKANQAAKNTKQSTSKQTTTKQTQPKSTTAQKGETTQKKIEKKTFND